MDASRETAAPPKLCWTVDETQRWNINLDDNNFFFISNIFWGGKSQTMRPIFKQVISSTTLLYVKQLFYSQNT